MIDVTPELPVHLGVVEAEGVRAAAGDGAFERLNACAERYRARAEATGDTTPGAVESVGTARALFRLLGIDPTRHRPSSEALLRRALQGRPQPRINTLVDVGNWCSLDFLLPLGVYDRQRLVGPVRLRQGREGESYEAVSNRRINLAGRYVLADDEGPFGSPITDSKRASIRDHTTGTVIILYAPLDYTAERMQERATLLGERVVQLCGGHVIQCEVRSGEEA